MKLGHGRYSRRRCANMYVVMVIVLSVFGCGILGLIGLHRLRETRSFSLLIKQKDDQILSLHHLLQKEREQIREVKRKTEEIKTEMIRLGSEKAELNGRISAMQSTVSSLREEQRAVELAYQERQNEVKLWRDKDQNHQVEIEDLKHRLQLRGESLIMPSNVTAEEQGRNAEYASRFGETEISMTSKETTAQGRIEPKYNDDQETVRGEKTTEWRQQVHKSGDETNATALGELGRRKAESRSSDEVQENGGKREKGKRWITIAKQTQGKRSSPSNQDSTMADEELAKQSPIKMEYTGSANKTAEDNEHSE